MRRLSDLATPVVMIDWATTHRNLSRMAERAHNRGMALCPHIKTHKSPRLAREQVGLGSHNVMVSKLGEAAVMLDGGITEQFIGYPLVDRLHEARLTHLISQGLRPRVAVDSVESVAMLSRVADHTGVNIPVLIEIDTGFHRCGLDDLAMIRALAMAIKGRGLPVQGITCFGGHIPHRTDPQEIRALVEEENRMLQRIRADLEAAGFHDLVVSEGGTVPAGYVECMTVATEMRPGTYVYNDVAIVMAGAATWDDCAARILTEVVSAPSSTRAVIDAGAKTLAADGPINGSYGYIVERPDLIIDRLSEEHGVVVCRDGGPTGLRVGERLHVVPNHVCTMINLHDQVTLVEDGHVVGKLYIPARGQVR